MKNENTIVNEVKAVLGRPVNPNSARQKRLAEIEAKRAAGEVKRGRPIKQGSKRQAVLAEREAKRAAGAEIKRGRPVNPNSERQARLAAKVTVSIEDAVKAIVS